jgi:UDP-N-acetylmuramoyl-L-alanyl-D-glutamate--2,6-diaminopimelate ligase
MEGDGPGSVTWQQALAAAGQRRFRGVELSGLTDDSRDVTPGGVFIALRGLAADGHAHIGEAVSRGAALVVCEADVACGVPTCRVPSGREALSELADAWFGQPSRHLRVVGVTGTAGKTTTAWLTAAVLRAAGLSTGVLGTAGAVLADGQRRPMPWTTPPPMVLHGLLAEGRAQGLQAMVMEVSAQGSAQARVDHCAFDVAAVTNLSREHGEYFADAASYRAAKLRLFERLGRFGKPAAAVLNTTLLDLGAFRGACSVPRTEYGPGGAVEVTRAQLRGMDGTDLLLSLPGGEELRTRLPLPGRHNIENALCAVAVGCALGLPRQALADGLAAARPVPGRLQEIQRAPWRVIVDYAHTPAGLRGVLGFLRPITAGRLLLVMGARGGRDQGKRPLMGAVAAALCDEVILTSDRPDPEEPAAAAAPMLEAVSGVGVPARFVRDRWQALQMALSGRSAGDCVVVAGKGDEPWLNDAEGDLPGDDMTACRRALLEGRALPADPVSSLAR